MAPARYSAGRPIEAAGPAVILSFALAAFVNWTVAMALGELARGPAEGTAISTSTSEPASSPGAAIGSHRRLYRAEPAATRDCHGGKGLVGFARKSD